MNKSNQSILISILVLGLSIALTFLVQELWQKALIIVLGLVVLWFLLRMVLKKPSRLNLKTKDYSELATKLIPLLGGLDNIVSINQCQTRVLLNVKDSKLAQVDSIRDLGISGVLRPSNTKVQLIVKDLVNDVAEALKKAVGQ